MMRACVMSIGFLAWTLFTASAMAQNTNHPFTLTIESEHKSYPLGTPVWVRITQTNTQSTPVDCTVWSVDSSDLSYHYEITDPCGKQLKNAHECRLGHGRHDTM